MKKTVKEIDKNRKGRIIIIFISLKLVTFINEKKKKREGEDLNNTSSCHRDD